MEPLRAIRRQLETLSPNEGLILIAPFSPTSLIEELGNQGFAARLEPGQNGDWFVWLWREFA
ncbi:MAG: DUF2249 domain-containing protein [Verrucomicrobia bacterium]|nr:DUF2249 domain-containing protein [Verrucomicrobiota bacterium]